MDPTPHTMAQPASIRNVAVIGTGVIGASWCTCFLAHGFRVTATDPAPGAEQRLREQVARQWPDAVALGAARGSDPGQLQFCTDEREAVAQSDFVQENGPERLEFKRGIFAMLDEAAPAHAILASSSSGIPASEFQTACNRPGRVLIGHPFNPPHLIPLVEVVGGRLTSAQAVRTAMDFYRAAGRKPIALHKELKGFVTNRLQAALWREAYGLVHAGVATVEDIDAAIANGPGLRWGIRGPFATQSLSGGEGGLRHLLEHLGPPMDDYWQDLFATRLTEEVKRAVLDSAEQQMGDWDMASVARERDRMLVALLQIKARQAGQGD
ncbi:MAG TPA: 3-hydroxyacyl-CoA dehydrogenase NAD-binding domain-containing protein [Steroidobacteraceae bacterium]|nr:3-hydroxyacyl-CoA dehydrogenase NAD-binding domain-containing protein [Steroidobacteraceae bacterium]